MSKIDDLLKRRRRLVTQIRAAWDQIERIDAMMLNRIETARQALLGDEPRPPQRERDDKHTGGEMHIDVRPSMMFFSATVREPKMKGPITHVLMDAKKPLTKDELHQRLLERGVKIAGKIPKNALSAHISYLIKTGTLVRIGNRLALKQQPLDTNENATRSH